MNHQCPSQGRECWISAFIVCCTHCTDCLAACGPTSAKKKDVCVFLCSLVLLVVNVFRIFMDYILAVAGIYFDNSIKCKISQASESSCLVWVPVLCVMARVSKFLVQFHTYSFTRTKKWLQYLESARTHCFLESRF